MIEHAFDILGVGFDEPWVYAVRVNPWVGVALWVLREAVSGSADSDPVEPYYLLIVKGVFDAHTWTIDPRVRLQDPRWEGIGFNNEEVTDFLLVPADAYLDELEEERYQSETGGHNERRYRLREPGYRDPGDRSFYWRFRSAAQPKLLALSTWSTYTEVIFGSEIRITAIPEDEALALARLTVYER